MGFFSGIIKKWETNPHFNQIEVLCPHYLKEFWTGHKPIVIH